MLSRLEAFVVAPGVSLDHQQFVVQGSDTPIYISPTTVRAGQGRPASIVFRMRSGKVRVTDALVLEPLFSAYDSTMGHSQITSEENMSAN